MEKFQILSQKIRQKPELSGIDENIILESVREYFSKHKIDINRLTEKQEKIVIKEIRASLRLLTGRFQISSNKRIELLKSNRIEELLFSHSSTKERKDIYPSLIEKIRSLSPLSILDLGCGLNPIAIAPSLKREGFVYYASDLNKDELNLISDFFNSSKIKGHCFVFDLRNISSGQNILPKIDLCLIFKVLDILEKRSHKLARQIIQSLDAKFILVSFATKKLSGKRMNFPKRRWFEKILESLRLKYQKIEFTNEIFYLIEKSSQK